MCAVSFAVVCVLAAGAARAESAATDPAAEDEAGEITSGKHASGVVLSGLVGFGIGQGVQGLRPQLQDRPRGDDPIRMRSRVRDRGRDRRAGDSHSAG
jgi:hypothetical protein